MSTSYLDLDGFSVLSLVPSEVIARVETKTPGWIAAQLEAESEFITAQLAKRYDAPFSAPYPLVVRLWLSRIVSASVYDRHGADPNDLQAARYYEGAKVAKDEIAKAADAEGGLYELPLRADTNANGVRRGGPRSYSEASPYVWTSVQRERASREDACGRGTRG